MPEVKRREIQRRQQRRERLWRGDTNNNGDGTDGAIKRAAKKILVKQLKEMREKQSRLKKNKKRSNVNGNDGMLMREEEENTAKSSSNDGALAAGFILDNGEENAISTTTKQQHKSTTKYKTTEQEDEVISINSKDDSSIMDQVAMIDQAVAIQSYKQQQNSEDENDWEMSMAVQESINDSLQHQSSSSPTNDTTEEETTTYDTINAKTGHHQTITSNQYNPNNTYNNPSSSATNEQIASFNMHERHEWIESQKRQQRITSRKECITAAANPLDYSNTQLKNFLKSSMLSKRVGEIDKLVKDRESNDSVEGSGSGGFDLVAEEEAYSSGGFAISSSSIPPTTRPLQRLKRQNDTQSDDNDDEDDELFTSSTNPTASSTANGGKTQAATMQALFGEDDIEEEGGGFLLPSSTNEPSKPTASSKVTASSTNLDSRNNEVVLLDDNSDDDSHNSVEVVDKDGNILENGKDTMILNHTAQASNNTQNSTAALPKSKLLELSTAEEEWEQWGGGEEADDVSEAAVQNNSASPSRANTHTAMDASDDSDSDNGQDNTFLTLGQITKRVYTSDTKKSVAEANESILPTKESNTAETEDEDEVDWEDGDSDGSDHHAEDEPTKDSNQIDSARLTSDNIDHQVHTETTLNGDQEDNLRHKSSRSTNMDTYTKSNDKNDVIELPSDDCEEESEAPPPVKQAPSNNKKKEEEPLVIDSSDDDNEFDTYHPDDPQAAALLRAQDTASRLTSWAGRAFQRAINDHATEQSHADLPSDRDNEQTVKEHIDLTTNDDEVIDIDEDESKDTDTSTDGKLPAQKTTETATTNNNSSTEQQQHNNQQVLFDTSLEGLTEAHNAILEEDRTMERDLSTMTDEMKEDILKLLQLCGIPWVESPSEAEAQCAALEELGLVDGVVTEDSDIFVFGAKKVYKNFFNENKYCEAYCAKDIQRDLGLGKHQLVALAMLLGGDYTDGVKGVGIVNGMEILNAFSVDDSAEGIKNGLQRLRDWLDGFGDPVSSSTKEVGFHNKHKSARTRWIAPADFPSHGIIKAYLQPVVDNSEATFSWGKPDLTSLQHYCAETLGWDQAETDRVVQPVLKVIEAGSKQTRLESYFMRYEDKQLAGKVKSKRLQAVLQDIQGNDNEIAGTDKNDMEMEDVDTSNDNDDEESKPKKKRQKR